jgi:hypothetical protein
MATSADDYNDNSLHHLRRDVHESHTSSQVAKVLSTIALVAAFVALALSVYTLDKANQASSDANRAMQTAEQSK